MITSYLIILILAPQLWIEPFIGIPIDFFFYPLWIMIVTIRGKLNRLLDLKISDFFFLAMIGWIIISSLINPSNDRTNIYIINYIKFFVMYRLTIASIDDFGHVKRVIFVMLLLSYLLVIESIQQKLSFDGIGWAGQTLAWADERILKTTGSGRTRWISNFDGPGVFCVIFTNILPFTIQYFAKHYSFTKKIVASVMTVPLLIAIYFTGSRGGVLATIAIFLSYLLIRLKISFVKIIMVTSFVSLIFILLPSSLTSIRDSNKSAQHRVDMWAQGVEMVRYNPVFGVGKGNFSRHTGTLIAHNSTIEIMAETGLPGLFFWLSLIFLSFKSIFLFFESIDGCKEKQSFAIALGVSVAGYIVSSMFVTLEYETFYFLLALAAVLGRMSNVSIQYSKKNMVIVSGAIVGFVFFLKVLFMIY